MHRPSGVHGLPVRMTAVGWWVSRHVVSTQWTKVHLIVIILFFFFLLYTHTHTPRCYLTYIWYSFVDSSCMLYSHLSWPAQKWMNHRRDGENYLIGLPVFTSHVKLFSLFYQEGWKWQDIWHVEDIRIVCFIFCLKNHSTLGTLNIRMILKWV